MSLAQAWLSHLKGARERFLDEHPYVDDDANRYFSAGTASHFQETERLIRAHARGRLLDVGAGRGAWQPVLERAGVRYESLERAPRGAFVPTFLGDVLDMAAVDDNAYDTLFCSQVLEHVPDPMLALSEMKKKLKPGGKLLITVPFVARRHELPHDYFRYTQEGLGALLARAGFRVDEVTTYGGLASLIHHQVSVLTLGATLPLPVVGRAAWSLNQPFSRLIPKLDRALDRSALLPLGVLAVAENP
jgi:SAM-dependent methyltransferase